MRGFWKMKAWLFGLRDHVEVVGPGRMNLVTREKAASAGGALDPVELALDAAVAEGPPGLSPDNPGPAVVPATVLEGSTSDSASEPREANQIAVSPAGTVVEFLLARLTDAESALTCRGLPLPLQATSYSDPGERDVAATRSLIAGCSAIFDPATGWESEGGSAPGERDPGSPDCHLFGSSGLPGGVAPNRRASRNPRHRFAGVAFTVNRHQPVTVDHPLGLGRHRIYPRGSNAPIKKYCIMRTSCYGLSTPATIWLRGSSKYFLSSKKENRNVLHGIPIRLAIVRR